LSRPWRRFLKPAAAGSPDVKETLPQGYAAGGKSFKVHLDGYDLAPYFLGEAKEGPPKGCLYWNDDGKLVALRYSRWKLVFAEQRSEGFGVWEGAVRVPAPSCALRLALGPVRTG